MYVTPGILCTGVLLLAVYTAPVKLSEVYRCPSGLTGTMYTYRDQCYRYVHSSVTWDVANADCSSSNGGHLVVILDQAIQNFISSLPFPSDAYQVWIGFSDKIQEQTWKWVTGTAWSYDAWDQAHPQLCYGDNRACPEDCAYLRTSNGMWSEDHCNNAHVKYQYICQYNMSPTTTSTTTTSSPTTTKPSPTTTKPSPMTTKPATSKTLTSSTATTTTLPVTTQVTTLVTTSPLMTTTKTTSSSVTTASIMSTKSSTTAAPMVGRMGQLTDDGGALSQGGLIGLVLALILVVIVIALVLLVIVRKRNRRKRFEADDFQVRFQNHTYGTNRPPSSYQTGACNDSKSYATSNIYETPGPKQCNRESNCHGYENPVNRSTLDRIGQESHYASVKECDMVYLPDTHPDMPYKQSERLNNTSAGLHYCSVSSEMTDPSYVSPKPQKEMSEEVLSNRSNEGLLRCLEEYSKDPGAYDNNLYINNKNSYVNK
ncbi:uncharacterized protein LOC110441882 isoform X4 [Mizuhopecten yessoensis]|uniref:uncharacterized protein LOC110441882 isoform X4 n=1 Tax=Mizuhopecten yessoensis TaxID=6573 RepID=UPI000B45E8D7|nr:uncharacterized protein LOC110441882 isoform X4 [Mizuhopecten yessoensis]